MALDQFDLDAQQAALSAQERDLSMQQADETAEDSRNQDRQYVA